MGLYERTSHSLDLMRYLFDCTMATIEGDAMLASENQSEVARMIFAAQLSGDCLIKAVERGESLRSNYSNALSTRFEDLLLDHDSKPCALRFWVFCRERSGRTSKMTPARYSALKDKLGLHARLPDDVDDLGAWGCNHLCSFTLERLLRLLRKKSSSAYECERHQSILDKGLLRMTQMKVVVTDPEVASYAAASDRDVWLAEHL